MVSPAIPLLVCTITLLAPTAAFAEKPADNRSGLVKVAAVQILGYDKGDLPRPDFDPTKTPVRYIQKAAADGAQLVVFPEYVLGHIAVPGPETEKISRAATAGRIYVVIGCWEVGKDGARANTAILFDRAGQIAGKYRKVHAAVDHYEGEPPWSQPPKGRDRSWFLRHDPEWIMEKGSGFPVFDLDFGRIGILTRYDGWFPESTRILSLKGAELLVWINGRGGTVEDYLVRAAIFQNEAAMIATNQAYGSGTMIAQWPSQVLASCPEAKEAYITATLDLGKVRRARQTSRNLQQRRPEAYGEILEPVTKRAPAATSRP